MSFSHARLNATLNGTSGIPFGRWIRSNSYREARSAQTVHDFSVRGFLRVSRVLPRVPPSCGPCGVSRTGLDPPGVFCTADAHTILAIVIVPLILIRLRRGLAERFDKHKVIAKWTLPPWFYVCVTGVIVYWMVYQLYAPIRV
jgi:Protein of unknown function (DUF420)